MNAVSYGMGVGVGLALRGEITQTGMRFAPDRTDEEPTSAVVNILKANAGEASMMARYAGKTHLHDVEPEDLRSVTLTTAATTGTPLAGTRATVACRLCHFAATDSSSTLNQLSPHEVAHFVKLSGRHTDPRGLDHPRSLESRGVERFQTMVLHMTDLPADHWLAQEG